MSLSAATPSKGLSPEVAKESLAYLRRAVEKMKSLQATEKVIAHVERGLLNRVPQKFDLKPLVTAINTLNLILRGGKEDKISFARATVKHELETVYRALSHRDEFILPAHLRQFCEREGALLDLNALAALTSFYRTHPQAEANRGKYDFVVTRLFSSAEAGRYRQQRRLRISREQIAKRLTEMCAAWGEIIQRDPADADRIITFIHQFDQFIAEIKQINNFADLVAQDFFPRVRNFKVSVGNLLYLPEVTAASIESNVIIANRFLSLLESESKELCEAPESIHQLMDAFSDIYSNESDEISRILTELQTSSQHDKHVQERISRFTRLLQSATKDEEALSFSLSSAPAPSLQTKSSAGFSLEPGVLPVATTAMPEEWQAFAAQPENRELLAAYHQASTEVRKLELYFFLSPLPHESSEELKGESKSRRAALELIFRVDQTIQAELGKDREPSGEMDVCVDNLFDALGQCGDELRDLTQSAHKRHQQANYEILLHVNNQLMAARLRLQSAIVRRSAREILPYEAETRTATIRTPTSVQETSTEKENKVPLASVHNSRRKWLMIAVILLAVAAVGARLVLTKNIVESKDDADVVRLASDQVPNGELFTQIKLHRDLLLCLVTDKWLTISAREQKEKLQELLSYGQERGATRILLLDSKGVTVGSATQDDLYVN
jgi:Mg2+ and Co2+ transporter CorA